MKFESLSLIRQVGTTREALLISDLEELREQLAVATTSDAAELEALRRDLALRVEELEGQQQVCREHAVLAVHVTSGLGGES